MGKINRIEVLQKQMREKGIEAALIENRRNREYLVYADIWEGSMLITQEEAVLLVDFRYYEMASLSVRDCEVRLCKNIEEAMRQIVKERKLSSVCCEKNISHQRYL